MKVSFIRLAMLAAFSVAVMGQAPKTSTPAASDVLKATLQNGMRVVIVRNAIGPVVALQMTYLVGSRDDPADVPGMAHAQEHMMYRGTRNLSTSELGTVATALGGSFNAATTDTTTQFQFTIPSADLDAVLRIEADRMRDVLDAQAQWENERGAIEQEVLRNETQPGDDFFRAVHEIVFAGTPYGHEGVGTRRAFNKLTGPQLKAFWERWYAPNNAVLVIAGDVDPARTLAAVRAHFESIPKRAVPAHAAAHLKPLERTVLDRATTLPYPLAAVAVLLPGIESPDFLPSYVLQGILGSERGPIRALVDSGQALGGDWVATPYLPEGQLAYAVVPLAQNADPQKMAQRLEGIFTSYAQNGVPSDLFESTKRRLITSQEISRNSVAALASDWATTIAVDGEPSIAHEQQLIADVTLAEVNHVAKKYLDVRHAIVGTLRPSANPARGGAPSPPQNGPERPLAAQPPVTHLPDWAKTLVEHIAAPPAPAMPAVMTLSNGIKLIVQPETISDSVFLFGSVKTNAALQEPIGKEGVASVLSTMFEYGTAQRDRLAFLRAQDDADTELVAGAQFRMQTTSHSFDKAVALLAENQLQPRLDQPTFELARRRAIDQLETALNSSNTVSGRRAEHALLPPSDPELREPTVRALQSLTLDDVKSYYAKTLRPDLTTIVVAGNVTPDVARAAVEREFAGWHATGALRALDLPALPLNQGALVRLNLPLGQDVVRFQQIVPLARTNPQLYPLLLGDAILGGGSFGPEQSRLFRDLRQNTGLVYSIASQLSPRRSEYEFSVAFASLPANEARISSLIDGEIARMKSQPVGDFELELAKASTVRASIVAASSVDAIADALLYEATHGLPFNQSQIDAQQFLATDASAIAAAFAKYIHPEHFVRVIEGP